MTERVLFITRQHLKVFMWQKNTLIYEYDFINNESGLTTFSAYLNTINKQPVRILLDVFEEEYQYETIPYTLGADRKALIKRLLDRLYRDNIYKHAHITGRKQQGRKDLEILLTSISNTDSIDKWINLINQQHIPIMGIWSTPLIAEEIVKTIFKKEKMLLIFRNMRSALRESYYFKKRLYVSRLERIKKEVVLNEKADSYVTNNIASIKRFLANQRIIGFDEKMTIGCILPASLIENAQTRYPNTEQFSYQFESLENVAKTLKIQHKNTINSDAILAFICSQKRSTSNHYPLSYNKTSYTEYKIGRVISKLGVWGNVFLLLLSTILLIQAIDINNVLTMNKTKLEYSKNNHFDRFEPISEQLNSAEDINNHIQFIHQLQLESHSSPEKYFSYIGNTLNKAIFSGITLTEIEWEKLKPNEIEIIKSRYLTHATNNDEAYNDVETQQTSGLTPTLTLIGNIKISQSSYRETITTINNFIADINSNEKIQHVIPLHLPMDPRDSTLFSDSYKLHKKDKIIEEGTNKFEILLLLEPTKVVNSHYTQGF